MVRLLFYDTILHCEALLGRGQSGLMRWICNESCPWRKINRSTCWPAVQRATIPLSCIRRIPAPLSWSLPLPSSAAGTGWLWSPRNWRGRWSNRARTARRRTAPPGPRYTARWSASWRGKLSGLKYYLKFIEAHPGEVIKWTKVLFILTESRVSV